MIELTQEEYIKEMGNGAGYYCFMGGCEGKNGKEILGVGDKLYLFEKDEVGGINFKKMIEEQKKEGEKYDEDYFGQRDVQIMENRVWAVQEFRTDTTKEHDRIIALYESKSNAERHMEKLNKLYSQDIYCTLRTRVEPLEIRGDVDFVD